LGEDAIAPTPSRLNIYSSRTNLQLNKGKSNPIDLVQMHCYNAVASQFPKGNCFIELPGKTVPAKTAQSTAPNLCIRPVSN
jgi:hypothetical protein